MIVTFGSISKFHATFSSGIICGKTDAKFVDVQKSAFRCSKRSILSFSICFFFKVFRLVLLVDCSKFRRLIKTKLVTTKEKLQKLLVIFSSWTCTENLYEALFSAAKQFLKQTFETSGIHVRWIFLLLQQRFVHVLR